MVYLKNLFNEILIFYLVHYFIFYEILTNIILNTSFGSFSNDTTSLLNNKVTGITTEETLFFHWMNG